MTDQPTLSKCAECGDPGTGTAPNFSQFRGSKGSVVVCSRCFDNYERRRR